MADWINCVHSKWNLRKPAFTVTISMVHTVVASVKCSRHKMSFGCIPSFRNCLMRNFFITTLVRPRLAQIDDSTFSFLRAVSLARYSYFTLVKGVLDHVFSNWLNLVQQLNWQDISKLRFCIWNDFLKGQLNAEWISALPLINFQGRNPGNFWLVFWEKHWPHKFILHLIDL